MNTVLSMKDMKLIMAFYEKLNILNEDIIKNMMDNIEVNKIVAARVENGEITSMIVANLIKSDYYLEKFLYLDYDIEKETSLLKFLVDYLKTTEVGINIYFDNYPYDDEIDKILIQAGFKYNFINYVSDPTNEKIEEFKTSFKINDKSDDVKKYLCDRYNETIISNAKYLGIKNAEILNEINLDNTNIVVIRDNLEKVIGVSRFGIVNEYMFINSIYADSDDIYLELLKIIKGLTSRVLQIGVLPVRKDLINLLNQEGYKVSQTDYIKILIGDENE